MKKSAFKATSAVAVLSLFLAGCTTDDSADDNATGATPDCRQLDDSLEWHDGVREFLQSAIDENSTCTGTAPDDSGNVAVFDWDDTVVKNGIGYVTNYYMIENDLVLQPPEQDWRALNRYLTDEAVDALEDSCGTEVPAGSPLPTSSNINCANEIVALLESGEVSYTDVDARRMQPAYLWSNALLTGYTKDEVKSIAEEVRADMLSADVGTTQKIANEEVTGYIRYYPQMKDLIGTLQEHGIEPWIVSASPEPIVEVWAPEVGIDEHHAIGIRNVYDSEGKQTTDVLGCGDTEDGDNEVIPYIDGKRCWANQEIFGAEGSAAFDQLPEDQRQVIAGGDSVTDSTFVGDATAASLVINRNQPELMCRAYDDLFTDGGTWAVNPMFIEPNPQHDPYDCANAYINPDGSMGQVQRDNGEPIPEQEDTVF